MYKLHSAVWEHHPTKVKNHEAYFLCMTIEGPKGGLYLLDKWGTERLVFEYMRTHESTIGLPYSWMTFAKANNMDIAKTDMYDKNPWEEMIKILRKAKPSVKVVTRDGAGARIIEKIAKNINMVV